MGSVFRKPTGYIGRRLKIELFGSQLHGLGNLSQAGAARFGAVLHLGVGSLSHVRPCRNFRLGESPRSSRQARIGDQS